MYRQMGNSVAVPVVTEIAKQMQNKLLKPLKKSRASQIRIQLPETNTFISL
jgi:hypothetical protein